MLQALNQHTLTKDQATLRSSYTDLQTAILDTTTPNDGNGNGGNNAHTDFISPPLCVISNNKRLSHAIEQRNRSSSGNIALFGAIVLFLWLLTLLVPFYAWLFIVFSAGLYHRCAPYLSCAITPVVSAVFAICLIN